MTAITSMRAPAIVRPVQIDIPQKQEKSFAHHIALMLVALAMATSGIVLSEPAPIDALSLGLIILLPVIGLARITRALVIYLALWLIVAAGHFYAAMNAQDLSQTLRFSAISVYLHFASFVFAAFVALKPEQHTNLVLRYWSVAAVIAALPALAGYFDLVPGAQNLFTKFGRAAGTFKDPNVFGPFLVAPILYFVHLTISRSLTKAAMPLATAGLLALALLLSFSRGAWLNFAVAISVYAYLALITAQTQIQRARITGLLAITIIAFAAIITIAVQFDAVGKLLSERASLTQSYDTGPEGRFGGQEKAVGIIAETPVGIGARTFPLRYHGEDVHNVYLSMFLNAGWLGGSVYIVLVALTLFLGLRFILFTTQIRPIFLVIYATFAATAIEGLIVDTDHWRHFYLLMGLTWGIMTSPASWQAPASHKVVQSPRQSPRTRQPKIVR